MLYSITTLILDIVVGLLAGLCLLRWYMQHQRIPMSARSGNPMGNLIFALTDWLVLPLRRVVRPLGRWDMASLVGAFLVVLAKFGLLWLLGWLAGNPLALLVYTVFALVAMCLSGMTGIVIIYAILSWVQTDSPVADLLQRLVMPMLNPIRRLMPLVGGIDLSPLVLLVLLQILSIVLGSVQAQVLMLI